MHARRRARLSPGRSPRGRSCGRSSDMSATSPVRTAQRATDPRLATLCRLYDIEPQYRDVWGNVHDIDSDTARVLLRAMGVEVAGRSLDELIAGRQAGQWHCPLVPAQVIRVGEASAAALRLPEARAGESVAYTLALATGGPEGDRAGDDQRCRVLRLRLAASAASARLSPPDARVRGRGDVAHCDAARMFFAGRGGE